jgi:methyl-accepting chemotaxis protein
MEMTMTTKFKIINGFAIMIVISTVVAAFGLVELKSAEESFTTYRRFARVNVIGSDMNNEASNLLRHLNAFLEEFNPALIDTALSALDAYAAHVKEARAVTHIAERQTALDEMGRQAETIRPHFFEMRNTVAGVIKILTEQVSPAYSAVYAALRELSEAAGNAGDTALLLRLNAAWLDVAQAMTTLGRFSDDLKLRTADRSLAQFVELQKKLAQVQSTIAERQILRHFDELMKIFDVMVANIRILRADVAKKEALVQKVRDEARSLSADIARFSKATDESAREVAESAIQSNAKAEKILLAASASGLAFGVLVTLIIILGLMRVLGKLSTYAEAVAGGDFEHEARIAEKGEIGKVVEAMHTIPGVLNDILATYDKLARDIQYGKLHSRADASRFRGGFATLIGGTNNIVGTLRGIIDHIPTPVLLMNKETKAEYMNLRAMEVAGSDGVGKTCRQLFNREDTDTPHDALKKALDTGKPAAAETRCRPRGVEMDIAYSALPILDKDGAPTAVLQLITDLTTIMNTERTMIKVAEQASGIASRVAAASEELAAQVEQVSQGTETQRANVASTANAMSEMTSTVLEVARNAGQASEQSGLTHDRAQSGSQLVNQVVTSINNINKVAATLQNNMKELGTQAESIGGVMNVISDIADQTNLLALNAAIEAARAGEAGRGFAVVADEVRKLAEKTMSATREVGSSISAIQQSAKVNIGEVVSAVNSINDATTLADSSGNALREIVELAAANSSFITSIATAAEEQSSTSEEINKSIEEINRVTTETSHGMVQSSAAVHELSRMAQDLNRVIAQLAVQ